MKVSNSQALPCFLTPSELLPALSPPVSRALILLISQHPGAMLDRSSISPASIDSWVRDRELNRIVVGRRIGRGPSLAYKAGKLPKWLASSHPHDLRQRPGCLKKKKSFVGWLNMFKAGSGLVSPTSNRTKQNTSPWKQTAFLSHPSVFSLWVFCMCVSQIKPFLNCWFCLWLSAVFEISLLSVVLKFFPTF